MHKVAICILIVTLTSCDEVFDYNFVVANNCEKEISVYFGTGNLTTNYIDTVRIKTNSIETIFIQHAAGGRELQGVDISIVFNDFFIKKESTLSSVNYMNQELWEYNEKSEFIGEYTLIIDSTHFE